MRSLFSARWSTGHGLLALLAIMGSSLVCPAGEPDRKIYWNVEDIRPGMKGTGQTVMVGTKLEEFGAEVLGVMRGVSPGRDMILCRLTGLNLEHAGIIQGMSGSPIYINGKLLGAVAFAWEFGKDPIAGVTPFEQMVQYVRSNDRRIAAEAKDGELHAAQAAPSALIDGLATDATFDASPTPVSGGALGGMRPIATPIAATGFSPRALAFLGDRFRPLGMAPMAGGAAPERVIREEGDKPLVPGSPLSIAMVTGDFDLSGIGTVTHVEGNRVYGFGHPMFSLGACEFPMMTGYIHTVYPRASVSMKMGSPLKVVGVLDTDVSTGVAGHLGGVPDMIPLSVRVKSGRYSEPQVYHVQIVREPNLLATLVMTVLTNAIDTEGNLPEELTAKIKATIKLKGHDPIELSDTLSGPRFTGQMGAANLFSPIASIVNILVRNPMAPIRLESIDCDVDITPGRKVATIESIRLNSDRLEPGQTLKGTVTIKPFKGERETVAIELPLPADIEEGSYEATICDMSNSLRRRLRNEPSLMEPRDLNAILRAIHFQIEPQRTALYLHVPLQDRGLSVAGQALPNLPGSARAVFNTSRQSQDPPVRTDLIQAANTSYVVEGTQALKFTVVKDKGISLK
ncbi:SpoIVB peptidase S55 domain-containing protein [Singulisphaera acidiphila]|uniref:SpoIVB peptidase S55 n=1 Tax=Singulisphaera acidiphila (strain ATCC BAA-1392 / DSM 18658 / VKM B-2454 / MOB10) TaxID=886293 RepID=L0DAX7_SINAD|nr:SpoIVB peptidase S55 domain-containing protein [Singulisphaera acidiphila]AGA26010.1 SpoIVB peptidase S55 [Singulisphaera acidiphila DSM 18658]